VISTTPERETGGELTIPNTVRLHRVLAMASPDRMTAIGDWL
jgi:hypothetical protein